MVAASAAKQDHRGEVHVNLLKGLAIMRNTSRLAPLGPASALAALACMLALQMTSAQAASDRVKAACKSDYFRHCSQHMVGSESLRQCMRGVGEDLSTGCLVALVEEGEITKQEIERYKANQGNGGKPAADQPAPAAKAKAAAANAAPTKSAKASKTAAKEKSSKTAATAKAKTGGNGKAGASKTAAVTPKSTAKASGGGKSTTKQTASKAGGSAKVASKGKSGAKQAASKSASKSKVASQGKSTTKAAGSKSTSKLASTSKPAAAQAAPKAPSMGLVGSASQLPDQPGPKYTHNVCQAQTLGGLETTWTCGLEEKCCFSPFFGQKSCLPQSAACN